MRVLLQAANEHLRTAFSLDEDHIGVQPTGRPPPFSGQYYIAIHPGPFVGRDIEGLDETYELRVTGTFRAGFSPADRWGDAIIVEGASGMYLIAEQIRVALHMNYDVLDLAGGTTGAQTWTGGKSYSLAAGVNGFVEPLRFRHCGDPLEVGPDWFFSEMESEASGWAVPMVFDSARRVQTVENMT